jgi:SAM-dependent methyltransferase
MRGRIYQVLNRPAIFALCGRIAAPGGREILTRRIADIVSCQGREGPLLDIGCGPESWLERARLPQPFGLDINPHYVKVYNRRCSLGVVGSATRLPFPNASFAGVWSVGLLHHLPDTMALEAVSEAWRVCRMGGYCAILDAVKPVSVWRRPVAALIRHLDRGEFMRTGEQLLGLLSQVCGWQTARSTYAATGLELLINIARK